MDLLKDKLTSAYNNLGPKVANSTTNLHYLPDYIYSNAFEATFLLCLQFTNGRFDKQLEKAAELLSLPSQYIDRKTAELLGRLRTDLAKIVSRNRNVEG